MLQTGLDSRVFLAIRDNLLLSNPVTARVNDFYYTYTLYPAEVFKTLDQKLIKTYHFEAGVKGPVRVQLADLLLDHDYLPVNPPGGPDLDLDMAGSELLFQKEGRVVLQAGIEDFITKPAVLLKEFSLRTDQTIYQKVGNEQQTQHH